VESLGFRQNTWGWLSAGEIGYHDASKIFSGVGEGDTGAPGVSKDGTKSKTFVVSFQGTLSTQCSSIETIYCLCKHRDDVL